MTSIPSRFLKMFILLTGMVGIQNLALQPATPALPAATTTAVSLVIGGGINCYLANGSLKCWGYNHNGAVGDNTYWDRPTPVQVSGLASGVTAIAAGNSYTCALLTAGGVKCWGANASGQLGDGTTTQHNTPVDVSGLSSGVTAIAAGNGYTCALLSAGGVKCWGANATGQLGNGTTTDSSTPVDVTGLTSGVTAVSVGWDQTCALTSSGGLKCWGSDTSGQLGVGTAIQELKPVDVVL